LSLIPLTDVSKKDLVELGLLGSILGHIGDGNFHETILFQKDQHDQVEKCVDKMVLRALEMEGTCTVSVFSLTDTLFDLKVLTMVG